MTSNQPYLLRAFYEWIVDNNLTPYIVVDANIYGVQVPQEHVRDGQIVLNISPASCGNFLLANTEISFDARFGGVPRNLVIPCQAVLAIYAKENGAGTVFTLEDEISEESEDGAPVLAPSDNTEGSSKPAKKGKPSLRVVK